MSRSRVIDESDYHLTFWLADADEIADLCVEKVDNDRIDIRRLILQWRKAHKRWVRMLKNPLCAKENMHGLIQQRHKVMGMVSALRTLGYWYEAKGRPSIMHVSKRSEE